MTIQKLLLLICLLYTTNILVAQDFITRGKIEFEIKKNVKKMFSGNENNSDFISNLPEFDVSYKDLIFSWGSAIYKPGKSSSSIMPSNNIVYTNLDKKQLVIQTNMMDENFIYSDSVRNIKWRITNETRNIIGFECRKAIGVIFDSVYVVAFYAAEIIPQSGPELFTGLPGMILGLAIPRYNTTWFATKLEVANIDEAVITAPTLKKVKQHTKKELAEIWSKKYKELLGDDNTPEKIEKKILGRFTL